MAPKVARQGGGIVRVSLVALTMTLVCYWQLGDRVSGGLDGKSKWQGVTSNNRGGTSDGRGITVVGQEECGVLRYERRAG